MIYSCNLEEPTDGVRALQPIEETGGTSMTSLISLSGGTSMTSLISSGGGTSMTSLISSSGGTSMTSLTSSGGTQSTIRISASAAISEIKIDPPGSDGNNEFIELVGEPGTLLSGFWLVHIESDVESNVGQIDKVIDLSKCSSSPCKFGSNGILLLVAAEGAVPLLDTESSVSVATELVRGGLENGTGYVGLFSGASIPKVGSDWDIDNDGRLEIPESAILHDAITWTDGDAGDALYAPIQIGPKPAAHAAWFCASEIPATSWQYGQLSGDATSLLPDFTHWSPQNLTSTTLTPGAKNNCAKPTLSTNGGATSKDSAGGSSPNTTSGLITTLSSGGSLSIQHNSTITNVNNGVGGLKAVSTVSGGDTEIRNSTAIIAIKTSSHSGGSSSFWSTSPFEPLKVDGGTSSDESTDGGSSSRSGVSTEAADSPKVPGACTVTRSKPRNFAILVLGLFVAVSRIRRKLRRN